MIFYGEYYIQLDEKNRMRIPAKLRELVGPNFYITTNTNCSLTVMDESKFMEYADNFKKVKTTNLEHQNIIRKIMASVISPDEDSQGRFVLPQNLREYAGITKKMVFIGVNDRMEIWSEDNYNNTIKNSKTSFDEAYAALAEFGI